jgi:hypothetical protein
MARTVSVSGTDEINANGRARADLIRRHCRPGRSVEFVVDRKRIDAPDAVGVFVRVPRLFGLLGSSLQQVGYLRSDPDDRLAHKVLRGHGITGRVASVFTATGARAPRLSVELGYAAFRTTR